MDYTGLGAGMAALAFWGFIAAVSVAAIWNDVRKRDAQHETLRRMVESGLPVDQALLDRLLPLKGGRDTMGRDLKIGGIIVLFVSIGLAILAVFLGQGSEKALYPLLGASGLVLCLGLGLWVASKVISRQDDDDVVASRQTRR